MQITASQLKQFFVNDAIRGVSLVLQTDCRSADINGSSLGCVLNNFLKQYIDDIDRNDIFPSYVADSSTKYEPNRVILPFHMMGPLQVHSPEAGESAKKHLSLSKFCLANHKKFLDFFLTPLQKEFIEKYCGDADFSKYCALAAPEFPRSKIPSKKLNNKGKARQSLSEEQLEEKRLKMEQKRERERKAKLAKGKSRETFYPHATNFTPPVSSFMSLILPMELRASRMLISIEQPPDVCETVGKRLVCGEVLEQFNHKTSKMYSAEISFD